MFVGVGSQLWSVWHQHTTVEQAVVCVCGWGSGWGSGLYISSHTNHCTNEQSYNLQINNDRQGGVLSKQNSSQITANTSYMAYLKRIT